MTRLIRAAISNRVLPNILMVLILAAGAVSITTLTVRVFPEISLGTLSVSVAFPGAAPADALAGIVEPVEDALEGVAGIREISATARANGATVIAELDRGASVDDVLREVETRVGAITTFPEEAEDPRISEVEPEERAAQVLLTGPVGLDELKPIAERVREDLLARETISQVSIAGVPDDLISIEVSRDTLKRFGLSLPMFAEAVSSESLDLAAGELDSGGDRIRINTEGERETAEEFRETVMFTAPTGAAVNLGSIATVTDGFADTPLVSLYGDLSAVFLNIDRVGDQQIITIVDDVESYLEDELRASLPGQVEAILWENEASALQGRINLLTKNGAIGITLILIVLALFLDLRIAAWVAMGVVISFVGTFALMALFGISINQLSLFGFILALGIVVDDAIVVGEAVYAEQARTGEPIKAAETATSRMAAPVFFSVSTTIAAFVPLLFLPGASGAFIFPVAAIVIMVLSLSLFESFFILPRHLSRVDPNARPGRFSPRRVTDPMRRQVGGRVERFADTRLRSWVHSVVRRPLIVVAAAVAVLVASLGLLAGGHVKFVFFPQIEGNTVTARLEMPESVTETVTLARSDILRAAARETARSLAETHGLDPATLIQGTTTSIGFAPQPSGPGGSAAGTPNVARVSVKLIDAADRPFGASAFQDAWRDAAPAIAGARAVEFSASLVGVGAAIAFEVAAASETGRNEAVSRLREALEGREGVIGIRDGRFTAARQIDITPKPAAGVYDLSVAALARQIRAAVFGAEVATLQRDREEVEVRARLPSAERDSVADLRTLPVRIGRDTVPLGALADLNFSAAPSVISRVAGRTVTGLTAYVNPAVTTGGAETAWIMENVVPGLESEIDGLTVRLAGEQQEQGRTTPAMVRNFILAMFGVYAILTLAFGSYLRPVLVLGAVPFGVIGALVGHYILGLNLTLLSVFGIIGLSGILINGGLLINDFVLERERAGDDPFEAIVESTVARFRPILLTTLTTFLGIFPLILETSVQASFLIPTAVSLAFGVLVGSVILIFLMPAYCALYAEGRRRLTNLRNRFHAAGHEAA